LSAEPARADPPADRRAAARDHRRLHRTGRFLRRRRQALRRVQRVDPVSRSQQRGGGARRSRPQQGDPRARDRQGFVGIGPCAYAAHDYLAKDPIRTSADFKGKKIGVKPTPIEREAMARLGATASPMPLNEVLPALQRNVIDGTRSAISIFVTLKYQDVSKLVTVTNDTMLVPVATVSKPWFDKLPADLQKAVMDAGAAAEKRTDAFTGEFMAGMPKRWVESGGEIFVMPAAEQAKVAAALKTVGDDVTKDDPPVKAFFERVRTTAAKH